LHWVLLPTKNKQQRATFLKQAHFDYWNRPLNMGIHVCYKDYHEAGLCCYLVIHIENLLHPLQLFYFHLWPIYWLSLKVLCQSFFEQWLKRSYFLHNGIHLGKIYTACMECAWLLSLR
jgi:hypothetical protein